MIKFNAAQTMRTVNQDGHMAYRMHPKERLITQVLTSFFGEQKYYGDNSNEIVDTLLSVCADDPAFVAKLGIFARTEFNMRSISHVIAAVLANVEAGKPYARMYTGHICLRADDMTEILACYIGMFGKPIPNSLKKGLSDALRRFDEYALAKYDRDGAVKLRDVVRIAHPAPATKEQESLWKKVLDRTLDTPVTWETQLSAHGNNKATWEKLIAENALGYMAMLRNLRNIITAQPENIEKVYTALADPDRVRKSRVLPFRFYSAYRELRSHPNATSRVMDVLEAAIEASVANMHMLPGKTFVAIDVSGSMGSTISNRSSVRCCDIACLMGVIANRICEEAIVTTFDTGIEKLSLPRTGGILATTDAIVTDGGGTNIHLPFDYMKKHGLKMDRLILLSDNQVNCGSGKIVQTSADACRKTLNADMWVHAIDLQGYGTQQFVGSRTNIIAGWSEKVLDFVRLAEDGIDSLSKRIDAIEV